MFGPRGRPPNPFAGGLKRFCAIHHLSPKQQLPPTMPEVGTKGEQMLLTYMRTRLGLNNELNNESGQALVEYALIIALVALVAAVGLAFLGGKVSDMFTNIGSQLH